MFRCPPAVMVIFVMLFAFLTAAASTVTTCNPQFDDVPSRTVLSAVVFQGPVTQTRTITDDEGRHETLNVVDVQVTGVLKGNVTSRTATVIGECPLDVEIGSTYVVFAVAASNSWSHRVQVDSGGLYGVLGHPVPASRRVLRQVNDYVERRGTRPTVRLRPRETSLDVRENRPVRIQCRGNGRPAPRYLWTKDDILLQSSRHLQITLLRRGSRLQIRRAMSEDSGVYKCQAINVVGNSSVKAMQVNVAGGTTQRPSTTEKDHSRRCATQGYCLNGGTCYVMVDIGRTYCQCPEMYNGHRCERKVVRPVTQNIKTQTEWRSQATPSPAVLIILLSGILLAVFLAFVVTIICLIRNRWKNEAASKNMVREYLIRNGSGSISSSNTARISQHRSNVYINVTDMEMTSVPASTVPVSSGNYYVTATQQAPATSIEVQEPNSGPLVGQTYEDRNHTNTRPSSFQQRTEAPAPTTPFTSQQPSSDRPSYSQQQSITELSHKPESQVPAGTRFQRNSSGYPIDSDPEASVV